MHAEDMLGQGADAFATVVVVDTQPPTILLNLAPAAHNGSVGLLVLGQLEAAFPGTDIAGGSSVEWHWGDGSGANGTGAAHAWSAPGNYTVPVRATDAWGNANATTFTVRVSAPPSTPPPPPAPRNAAGPLPTATGLSDLAIALILNAGAVAGVAIGFRAGRSTRAHDRRKP